jgi:hypothetical protein
MPGLLLAHLLAGLHGLDGLGPVASCQGRLRGRPALIVHVQKAGGSSLCAARYDACALRRGCRLEDMRHPPSFKARNCQLSNRHLREHLGECAGADAYSPNITAAQALLGADLVPSLCRTIAIEPHTAGPGRLANIKAEHWSLMRSPPAAPIWRAYTLVLLVREPVSRALSYIEGFLIKRMENPLAELPSGLERAFEAAPPASLAGRAYDAMQRVILGGERRGGELHGMALFLHFAVFNAHTQVLHPWLRALGPSRCGPPQLSAARAMLPRFHVVLNFENSSARDPSIAVARALLGINASFFRPDVMARDEKTRTHDESHRNVTGRFARLNISEYGWRFSEANAQCDTPLVLAATERLLEQARRLGASSAAGPQLGRPGKTPHR